MTYRHKKNDQNQYSTYSTEILAAICVPIGTLVYFIEILEVSAEQSSKFSTALLSLMITLVLKKKKKCIYINTDIFPLLTSNSGLR